ncbi:MAG: F0F1 ATP synthase subunit gamma, partial [Planctomycetaceae bacterium]|nr:F0F1 ATP synthase subunit gamma [Planctomycetaceae bacterium]
IAGLTELLMQLGQDLLEDYLEGTFDQLELVSARFDGVGEFTPVVTSILPIQPSERKTPVNPSPYISQNHLLAVAIREYLYIRLFQTVLDSLASEHGARLVATQSAGEWLASKTASTHRKLASIRREATTQEVLEIAATVRVATHRDVD